MKKLLFTALVIAGCAKANDVGRMQEEAIDIAQEYQPTVHELELRSNELLKTTLAADADSKLKDARAQIASMKGLIAGTTRERLEAATKGDPDAVQKKIDNIEDLLREGIIHATDELEAVESWIAVSERTPVMLPPAPAIAPAPAQ